MSVRLLVWRHLPSWLAWVRVLKITSHQDAESPTGTHRVNTIMPDKTGTITEGKPVVTDLTWETPDSADKAQQRDLYALEAQSRTIRWPASHS